MMRLLLTLAVILFFVDIAYSGDGCRRLASIVKKNSKMLIADDFPWYYIIGLIQTETNCRWLTSLDGQGSIGFMQLTPGLMPKSITDRFNIYDPVENIEAGIYYIYKVLHKQNPSSDNERQKKLWLTFQMYNGGMWPVRECNRAKSFEHQKCYQACINCDRSKYRCRGKVCVWLTSDGCKQYRSACDINYSYSKKIYRSGQSYIDTLIETWTYW